MLNFLYTFFDSFWFDFTHTEVHIRLIEQISGKLVLDVELCIYTLWLLQIWLHPYRSPHKTYWTYFWQISPWLKNFLYLLIDSIWWNTRHKVLHIWPNGHISGQRVLCLELSIHNSLSHSDLTWVILTYWRNFWKISPRWWTFYIKSLTLSDGTSDTEYCTFDLIDIFLSNWYSILNFQIHTHWLSLISLQPRINLFLTYWTNFWQISPWCWKFYTDLLVFHQTDSSPYLTFETYF